MGKQYTDEYLINKVIEQAKILGKTPTMAEFPHGPLIPSRFGTWNHFLELAGLQKNLIQRDPEESKRICIETVKTWIVENGRVPTKNEWDQLKIFPSTGAIVHHFGTWGKFLEELGIPKPTVEYLTQLVQEEYRTTGETPISSNFPHIGVVINHFGSWNEFLKQADIPLRLEQGKYDDWTDEQFIEQYIEVSNQHGKPLIASEFRLYDIPPIGAYLLRFGSMNNLRKKAGMPPTKERTPKYTNEMIRDTLISLYQRFGRRLTTAEMYEHSPVSVNTILRKMQKTSMGKIWDDVETWIGESTS